MAAGGRTDQLFNWRICQWADALREVDLLQSLGIRQLAFRQVKPMGAMHVDQLTRSLDSALSLTPCSEATLSPDRVSASLNGIAEMWALVPIQD